MNSIVANISYYSAKFGLSAVADMANAVKKAALIMGAITVPFLMYDTYNHVNNTDSFLNKLAACESRAPASISLLGFVHGGKVCPQSLMNKEQIALAYYGQAVAIPVIIYGSVLMALGCQGIENMANNLSNKLG